MIIDSKNNEGYSNQFKGDVSLTLQHALEDVDKISANSGKYLQVKCNTVPEFSIELNYNHEKKAKHFGHNQQKLDCRVFGDDEGYKISFSRDDRKSGIVAAKHFYIDVEANETFAFIKEFLSRVTLNEVSVNGKKATSQNLIDAVEIYCADKNIKVSGYSTRDLPNANITAGKDTPTLMTGRTLGNDAIGGRS
jgi:hypothetical protein